MSLLENVEMFLAYATCMLVNMRREKKRREEKRR
jgi:hypothetical protein